MSIKKLVNDPSVHGPFLEELDDWIERERKSLEACTDTVDIYRHQGAVRVLRRLKTLRDIVNGRD